MAQANITVYTTPLCGPCEALKRALMGRGVHFRTVDLLMDEAAAERLEEKGIRSAPALEIDGRIYAGAALSDEKLDALLQSRL
ncbi:MAG: glutaredoxin family protein [Reyranella sp.]|jgi:glutaredoxin|nr:glutaredoxin family protein [Reyranella sp.]MBL6651056.1 glutaredoxin family protein [Reyranella sp.]